MACPARAGAVGVPQAARCLGPEWCASQQRARELWVNHRQKGWLPERRPTSDPIAVRHRYSSATLTGHYGPGFVAKADSRIAITVNSGAHRVLLEWWAAYSGRSVSSLVSFLLEQAIVEALRKGDVPERAVSCMSQLIEARSEHLADEWQEQLALTQQSGLL
jgi:hypothetical protein